MTTLDLDFINFDDVPDAPPAVPEDNYNGRIVEAEVRESKSKPGSMYINYAAAIMDGEYAGRRVYGIWSLRPDLLWRMKRDFKRLGYEPSTPNVADLIGLEGVMKVTCRPRNDNPDELENRVSGWLAGV